MCRSTLAGVSVLLLASVVVAPSRPAGQTTQAVSSEARWQRAIDAWEAGAYPSALDDLRTLMRSAAASGYLERVALLTGELFTVTELTADGRNPRISANGQFATYETGPTAEPMTQLVRLGAPAPQVVAELRTGTTAFDVTGTRLAWLRGAPGAAAAAGEIVVRDLASGTERVTLGPGLLKSALAWSGDNQSVLFVGAADGVSTQTDIYSVREGTPPVRLTEGPGFKTNVQVDPRGLMLVYQISNQSPFAAGRGGRGGGAAPEAAARGGAGGGGAGAPAGGPQGRAGGGGGRGGAGAAVTQYVAINLSTKATRSITGTGLAMSADGSTLTWVSRDGDLYNVNVSPASGTEATVIRSGRERVDAPALSPDGKRIAYQLMTNTDWEIYVSEGPATHRRLTRDIQHDLLPRFLSNDLVLGLIGEARHRRSHLYDLTTGTRTRLFANNTVRTISPEYVWVPSASGKKLILQAERDGDTVSTERGIYVLDLDRRVSAADVASRIERQLATETELRTRMGAAFKPVADTIRQMVARASVNRVYEYEKTLFDFDSKHITRPGNRKAIEYLEKTYRSFGYSPVLQEFFPPALQGAGGTSNVVAMKRGTESPELIYVLSSHFDSVAAGPGADDDTSGTAALLETARILADVPLPATVVFASLTGEESGLLGSREFVRLAGEAKWRIVGALNNDMIGWGAESSRMDNTIRYSNAGIRDIQHGAAFLFTNLITYDAKYYKGTDAAAFFEGWGDIVGGIGSYPVLANPNYHQPTDFLETMNFRQILETSKVTAATLVHLASSPSRLQNIKVTKGAAGVEVTWTASPEKGVQRYIVAYGPANDPLRTRETVLTPKATLPLLAAGTQIAVKAVNARGLEGWDWARAVIQ